MQKTFEYGVDNTVSTATVELLILERNKGKTLRQLGADFGRSHERIRQLLAEHDRSPVTLLPELRVAANLRYPLWWLVKLRKKGIINPIKPGGRWLYSEEQVRQISLLIAELRKCEQCGKLRPLHSLRFCRECKQYRVKHRYENLSPEKKAEQRKRCQEWRIANPERAQEINSKAHRKHRAKHLERTS